MEASWAKFAYHSTPDEMSTIVTKSQYHTL